MAKPIKHYIIGDTQIRPGDVTDFLDWIAADIVRRKPDVIVMIGDWWDFPSMSRHSEPGSLEKENARFVQDLEAGNAAMDRLMGPIQAEIERLQRNKKKGWNPRFVFTKGNHEDRADRFPNLDARFEGVIGSHLCKLDGWEVYEFEQPVEIDGVWYCLEESHRVLTKDLRYIPLKDVKVGDELLAFDEHVAEGEKYRKYRTSTVEAHGFDDRQLFKVTLSDGKEFLTTEDHRWLGTPGTDTTPWTWLRTSELRPGSQVIKCLPEWEGECTYEAGYLGGILEGEGHLSKPNSTQGGIQEVSVLSVEPAGIGRIVKIKTSTGTMIVEGYAHHNCHYWKGPHSPRPIGGTIDNRLNKLGFTFVQGHEQGKRYGDRMLPNGKTIHGLVIGSCYLGTESYRGPQGTNEWRGVAVLNDVRDGDFEPMFLSLRYLCRQYTGEELHDYLTKRYPDRDWSHLK